MSSGEGKRRLCVGILDNDELTLMVLSRYLEKALSATTWCAALGSKAIELCRDDNTRPDVLLVDMSLNDMDGCSCIAKIREERERVPILAITSFPLHIYAQQAANAGAQGIVPKRSLATIRSAILAILPNGIWPLETEGVKFKTVDDWLAQGMAQRGDDAIPLPLSGRELEVIELFARGYTNEQISTELDVSANTVKTYANRIFAKLGAHTRSQAVALWLANR